MNIVYSRSEGRRYYSSYQALKLHQTAVGRPEDIWLLFFLSGIETKYIFYLPSLVFQLLFFLSGIETGLIAVDDVVAFNVTILPIRH